MFMGDASSTTEKEITNQYNLPASDVLKVGHHGSKTSSGKEFNYDYHYEPNDLIDIFKERISRQLYDLNHE